MTSLLKNSLVLMTAAGLAVSVGAQTTDNRDRSQSERQTQAERDAESRRPAQPGERREQSRDHMRDQAGLRVLDVHKAEDVLGADVVNPRGDTVGSIEEIIVDRGNGRIEFMVIKSGAILGIGGRSVAVPYEALGFDERDGTFSLNAAEDTLTDRASRHDDWIVFGDDADADAKDIDTWLGDHRGHDGLEKRWSERLKSADTNAVSGVITAIRHESNMAGGDCVMVDVRTKQGRDMTIALGPSWYVMGSTASPERGDEIVAKVVERTPEWDNEDRLNRPANVDRNRPAVRDPAARPGGEGQVNRPGQPVQPRDSARPTSGQPRELDQDREGLQPERWNSTHADAVALEARIDGQQLKLWNKDARSVWMNGKSEGLHQFVRLSQVIGSDVHASTHPKNFNGDDLQPGPDGEDHRTDEVNGSDYADAGDVQSAVIERLSGTVPALVIDPDQNFLGIGDTLRLVPWSVIRVGNQDGTVVLDADKDMLTTCREMPDDVSDLGTREAMAAIYVPFHMDPRTLHRRTSESAQYQPREINRP